MIKNSALTALTRTNALLLSGGFTVVIVRAVTSK